MTPIPSPDLDRPLTATEREDLTQQFLTSAQRFAALVDAARMPRESWAPWLAESLRPSPNANEPLEDLIHRWWIVFESEIRLLSESRNRIVHGVPIPDGELRRANYLASRLNEVTFRAA